LLDTRDFEIKTARSSGEIAKLTAQYAKYTFEVSKYWWATLGFEAPLPAIDCYL